jgi:hypothetical protein
MFEQTFKNIDDVLWKDAGCTSELDYTEQTSWLLFLKYLDGLEQDKATEAALEAKKYAFILDKPYRWESWAAPKGKDGKIDHNVAATGDDLVAFVNQKLFPYLQGFKAKASGPNTIEYKIGEIFGEIKRSRKRTCGACSSPTRGRAWRHSPPTAAPASRSAEGGPQSTATNSPRTRKSAAGSGVSSIGSKQGSVDWGRRMIRVCRQESSPSLTLRLS